MMFFIVWLIGALFSFICTYNTFKEEGFVPIIAFTICSWLTVITVLIHSFIGLKGYKKNES